MFRLISFDIQGNFGFFRKPDVNDGVQLSYNMIHKPSILGILGAILGLGGYHRLGEWPDYYIRLKHLAIGMQPLVNHERGNFGKTLITYTNTVGYANDKANLIIHENTLLKPSYRIFLLLDISKPLEEELYEKIANAQATYLPYFGKNECVMWWEKESFNEYEYEAFKPEDDYRIDSLFIKPKGSAAATNRAGGIFANVLEPDSFAYFEVLPIGFWEELRQYDLAEVAYTNWLIRKAYIPDGLYEIKNGRSSAVVQLL